MKAVLISIFSAALMVEVKQQDSATPNASSPPSEPHASALLCLANNAPAPPGKLLTADHIDAVMKGRLATKWWRKSPRT